MLFNSLHYLFFAPIVILVYFLVPSRFQKLWLLVTSLYFYAVFRVPFILLLIYSIGITYFCTLWMDKSESRFGKLFFLNIAIWGNLSLLYFFKYLDFSFTVWNTILGLVPCEPYYAYPSGILLPMGISFFTLQAIAYAVDVYHKKVKRAESLFQFGLFLSFFPQLVAGPIIRAQDMLHQFLDTYTFKKENLLPGIRQLAWGLFKKTFVADPIAAVIDPVFADPLHYGWFSLAVTGSLYIIQMYCDFSGYSDVAIGTGRIMGFHIPINFRQPFLSQTVSEFWRRWHISFSSWLKEYVYIFLGGNKKGVSRTYINLFLTTFVSGIWHGADWNFVVWGFVHASLMVIERFAFSFERIKNYWDKIPSTIKVAYPFTIFGISMYFFRARPVEGIGNSVQVGWAMVSRMFSGVEGDFLPVPLSVLSTVFILMLGDYLMEKETPWAKKLFENRVWVYGISGILISICFILYSVTVSAPFLYFQF
ncbi:MBOAT family O-acyltransferase [Leptospira haakeii]|uniref:MBOAT family protein n=1 Tax=Leptospira haakeii TaxID=2023198 RepID=A0ABX4PI77_9LEPT|nr:MBOAT family O-acyltransferase [Leptospira haakeii]PKA15325.1 hypothetical protein CH363_13970 [Leptospira haakeii]PKA18845.1 hypothetical protein CH377_15885 [Leptospira haakeii]